MKTTLIAGILLLFSFAGMAQDQVKLKESKDVIEGKILTTNNVSMKILLQSKVEKRMAFDVVDSIYCENDTIRKKLMQYSATKKKVKNVKLTGPKLVVVKTAELIDTNQVVDKKTAMVLNNTQLSQDLLNKRMVKGGNALVASVNWTIVGSLLMVGGALIYNKEPTAAYVGVGLGVIFNLIGLGNIATAGNYLNGTKAYSVDVGIQENGTGVRVKF
jgi:hypothetical protein